VTGHIRRSSPRGDPAAKSGGPGLALEGVPVPSSRLSATNQARQTTEREGANLADILERILNSGIVIAGDIKVNLLDIELLTIRIRLLIASVDKAQEIGIDWWKHDPFLSSGQSIRDLEGENKQLRRRIGKLKGRAPAPEQQPERRNQEGVGRPPVRRR
jgi:hypothetical protein